MNFFDHKDLGYHLLQLCPKVVKHPVYGTEVVSGGPVQRLVTGRTDRGSNPGDEEARIVSHVQAGPGGPPSLLYDGYRLSFSEVKRPGRGVDHPAAHRAEVKERVDLPLWAFVAFSELHLLQWLGQASHV